MSLNTAHANDGVLIHSGEYILLHSDNVSMEFSGQDNPVFRGSKAGRIYLTSHRMIFNNRKSGDDMQSFSAPFIAMSDVELEQPVFGANYIKGKVRAQPNGNFVGEVKFKLYFKAGGAIEYGMALLRAAKTAQSNYHSGGRFGDDPPPYTPSGNWHEAPPPAYQPPPGYYGWLPQHDSFTGPAPNSVYMSDNPPPYPGIGGPPAYGAPANNAPPYGAPANNAPPYGAPAYNAPPYGAPYGAPNSPPYGAPNSPPYGAPNNPPYGAPNGAPYGAPAYGGPAYGGQQQPLYPSVPAAPPTQPYAPNQQPAYNPNQQQPYNPQAQNNQPWNGFSAPQAESQSQQHHSNASNNQSQQSGEQAEWNGFSLPPEDDGPQRQHQQSQQSSAPRSGVYPQAPPYGGTTAPPPYPPYPTNNSQPAGYPPYPPQQPQPFGNGGYLPYPPAAAGPPAGAMGFTAPSHRSKEAEALASAFNTTENQRSNRPGPSGAMPPAYEDLPPTYEDSNRKKYQ